MDIDNIWNDNENQELVDFKFVVSNGSYCGFGGGASINTNSYDVAKKIEIEIDLVTFCKKILTVFRNTYLKNDDFLKETENKLLKFFDLRIE